VVPRLVEDAGPLWYQGPPPSSREDPIRHRQPLRRQSLAALAAAALLFAACGADDEPGEAPDVEVGDDDVEEETDLDAAPEEDDPADPAEEAEEPEDEAESPGAPPLDDEASTDDREEDGAAPMVSVTDVRVASHDGFDRVVFEIGGDGRAGWGVLYQDEARTQGKGEEVDLAGDAVLQVGLRNIAMPFDAPEDVDAYDGPERIDGPAGGVILEIVEDTIFEGQHVFFVGLDSERPFRIARLDDPQRVVIDVVDG
jgi:hypothetical protein